MPYSKSEPTATRSTPSIGRPCWLTCGWSPAELMLDFTLVSYPVKIMCCVDFSWERTKFLPNLTTSMFLVQFFLDYSSTQERTNLELPMLVFLHYLFQATFGLWIKKHFWLCIYEWVCLYFCAMLVISFTIVFPNIQTNAYFLDNKKKTIWNLPTLVFLHYAIIHPFDLGKNIATYFFFCMYDMNDYAFIFV
jgi:hypothetical protein